MRTKALLGLAALAATAVTATAANVYSLNVVGYVNQSYVEGFQLFANPLDFDGTGANNTVSNVLGNTLPFVTKVYTWNGSGFDISTFNKNLQGTATNWSNPNLDLRPGRAFWLQIATGKLGGTGQGTGTPGTSTFVGNVLQGSLANPFVIPNQFDFVGSMKPVAGRLTSDLNYTPVNIPEKVYLWNPAASGGGYTVFTYNKNLQNTITQWTGGSSPGVEPNLTVGQGFWLQSKPAATWTQNFTVQ